MTEQSEAPEAEGKSDPLEVEPDRAEADPLWEYGQSAEESVYEVVTEEQWKTRWTDVTDVLNERGIKAKVAAGTVVWQHSRIARSISRFSYQRGYLSAAGLSYMAIFSLAATLTVAWTIFAHLFTSNPEFQNLVVASINNFLPGILDDPATGKRGLINPESINIGRGNFVTGVIAFGAAAYAASRIIRYLIEGIRSMFGLLPYPIGVVGLYARYFLGLFVLLLAVASTASLSILSGGLASWLTVTLHLPKPLEDTMLFSVVSLAIPVAVDLLAFVTMVRFVSQVRVPRKPLWIGATAFAITAGVLQKLSEWVVRSPEDPIIVAAATVGTLLIWINLLATVALYVCAWMSNPPAVVPKVTENEIRGDVTPNYVTMSDPESLAWPHHPISGDLIPAVVREAEDEDGDQTS